MNNSHKKLVGSLSRACGNDLVSYRSDESENLVIYFWPPITDASKESILGISKSVNPTARIRVNKKQGKVTISS